jgi:hypothetical protein
VRVAIDGRFGPTVVRGRGDALNVAVGVDQPHVTGQAPRVVLRSVGLKGGVRATSLLTPAQAREYADQIRDAADAADAAGPDTCPTCGLVDPGPEHRQNEPLLCADRAGR